MNKKYWVTLLFILASSNVWAQTDTSQVNALIAKASKQMSKGSRDIAGAKASLDDAIAAATAINYSRGLKNAYATYSKLCLTDKDLQCAYKYKMLARSVKETTPAPATQPTGKATENATTSTESNEGHAVVDKTRNDTIRIKELSGEEDLAASLDNAELEALLQSKDSALLMKDTMLYIQMLKLRKKQLEAEKLDNVMALQKQELAAASRERWLYLGIIGLFLIGSGLIFYFLNKTRKQAKVLAQEKHRSETLLLNILPSEIATELKNTKKASAKFHKNVTVLFFDFVNFTTISSNTEADVLVNELDEYFTAFDRILDKYNIEKIKTIGDAYMCASGLWNNPDHAEQVLNFGLEILDFINKRKEEKTKANQFYFEIRCGVNTGGVTAGVVGEKKFLFDIWGSTVNLAARMEQSSEVGKINISKTTYELIKDKFDCTYRGRIEAKNVGLSDMYFVNSKK